MMHIRKVFRMKWYLLSNNIMKTIFSIINGYISINRKINLFIRPQSVTLRKEKKCPLFIAFAKIYIFFRLDRLCEYLYYISSSFRVNPKKIFMNFCVPVLSFSSNYSLNKTNFCIFQSSILNQDQEHMLGCVSFRHIFKHKKIVVYGRH